jgi:hypothetical protein
MQLCQLFCHLAHVKKQAEGNIWDSTETQNNSCEISKQLFSKSSLFPGALECQPM